MVEAHHHRPTLKQTNKKFKSKHASKSALKNAAKGRVARASPKSNPASSTAQSKLNRRNRAKQTQDNKREALISTTRIFSGVNGAPRIVVVIPLSGDLNASSIVQSLSRSLNVSADECPPIGLWKMRAERFKTSLQFINVQYKKFYAALDACKVADYVVFALSTTVEVDPWGDTLLRTLQAQGFPEAVAVAAPNETLDAKTRSAVLKSLLSFIQYFIPTQSRVFDLHSGSDCLNALRALSEGKPADVRWRDGRSWMLGETSNWYEGTMAVTGVVRGVSLSANRLVHLPNFGDFQIEKILSVPLQRQGKTGMDIEPSMLAEPNPDEADSLVSSNDPDDLSNEQTWPTEEEMNGGVNIDVQPQPDSEPETTLKTVRRIPRGMSAYQAAWIIDESENDQDGDSDQNEDESDAEMQGMAEEIEEMQELPMEEEAETDSRQVTFQDLNMEEEEHQLTSWRTREREEKNDLAFPDELDTPKDIPARVRFQRYRGLRSFRTSPWDPYENLPRDYARIFRFEDFKRTERVIRRKGEQELGVVQPGTRVTIHLKNVPREAVCGGPVVLFALLQHEHKTSVLNFTIQRNTEYDESVRSKDPLLLCVGPRRLRTNPLYSQHAQGRGGKGTNNVHKFERFLRHGVTNVATVYGPITFGKQPCVFLRETSDVQAPKLVATGTFINPDTNRIIAKRAILTGHPLKVHRKTATVRYMFFNPEDVVYFKPIQLHTKHGRMGHIRESLGTHGYFKAHFDGPITQMDTVCMPLYKRVFPRWSILWREGILTQSSETMEE